MNIILFDTETTGLLKPSNAPLNKQPRIIEMYACKINENFEIIDEYESFFSVPFMLSEEIRRITNISDEMLIDQPSFCEEYEKIKDFFADTDLLVAHNLSFDKNVLLNDIKRCKMENDFKWPKHDLCTVERTMNISGYRLSLSNLHWRMTGKKFPDAHRAKNDVFALVRSFHGMVEKDIIDLGEFK